MKEKSVIVEPTKTMVTYSPATVIEHTKAGGLLLPTTFEAPITAALPDRAALPTWTPAGLFELLPTTFGDPNPDPDTVTATVTFPNLRDAKTGEIVKYECVNGEWRSCSYVKL